MRISDWSSDVCSSDLLLNAVRQMHSRRRGNARFRQTVLRCAGDASSGQLLRRIERVSGRADGADQIGAAALVHRLAQPADVDVDGARFDLRIVPPYRVEQAFA